MTRMKIRTIINDMIAETNTLINTYDELAIKRYWIRYKYELQKTIEMLDDYNDEDFIDYEFDWALLDKALEYKDKYRSDIADGAIYKHKLSQAVEHKFAARALSDLRFRIDVNRDVCDIG